MTTATLKSPFPYAGGKSSIAPEVHRRFGRVANRVEPFCGSAAYTLSAPEDGATETINDADGLLSNALRAIRSAPEATAAACDRPINEADLTACHLWLKAQRDGLTARLFADPDYYDVVAAGRWLWGIASWIGDGWCVADGPWVNRDGRLVDRRTLPLEEQGEGVQRKMPLIGPQGGGTERMPGIQQYRREPGVVRQMPAISQSGYGETDKGIHAYRKEPGVVRRMPEVGAGRDRATSLRGVHSPNLATPAALVAYFQRLAARLRRVRVLCGDWRRAVADSVTVNHGTTAIFLDPPYPAAEHAMRYHDAGEPWYDAAAWAVAHGDDPRLRIAVCGYTSPATDALFPPSWARYHWTARGGYGNQGQGRGRENAKRECAWFSPHCCANLTPLEALLAETEAA